MELSFSEIIILYCLKKLKGERTIYAVYHLLHGKKSSQTIQDAQFYQLSIFFKTNSSLTRTKLEDTISKFSQCELIRNISKDQYILTDKGEHVLIRALEKKPIPIYLDGWKYQQAANEFWEKLSLAVQVISYLQKHDSKYMPIQRNPETLNWMKKFLAINSWSRETLGTKLYSELVHILESNPKIDPQLFVIRLSGYQSMGLTAEQAAKEVDMDESEYRYQFTNILHFMIRQILANKDKYPLLASFDIPIQKRNLTNSTEKTYLLFKQGFSISEIMTIRRLKKSTIEDHLVELALHLENFSIDPYVPKEKQKEIISATKHMKTKQLKQIRNSVKDANYFEIRLVLAKYGDQI